MQESIKIQDIVVRYLKKNVSIINDMKKFVVLLFQLDAVRLNVEFHAVGAWRLVVALFTLVQLVLEVDPLVTQQLTPHHERLTTHLQHVETENLGLGANILLLVL